jgi:hypothetical protein
VIDTSFTQLSTSEIAFSLPSPEVQHFVSEEAIDEILPEKMQTFVLKGLFLILSD